MLTDEPDNSDHYRIVLRANTHKRQRLDNSRFSSPITVDLPERELWEEDNEENNPYLWLGDQWYNHHNNKKLPSLVQIETGLINEALVQLREAMFKVSNAKAHVDAK